MATFIMFGTYSEEAMSEISPQRTDKAVQVIEGLKGKIISLYALLGEADLVFIVDFPDIQHAMKASVALNKATGIAFTTAPAVTVNEFDKLMSDL